jgi:group I intron endonuclease
MIIYKAQNKINQKIYIGQTLRSLPKRIRAHIRGGGNWFRPITNAIKKYGIEAFEFVMIDHANSREELNEKEMRWIRYYNCVSPRGYNLTAGGAGLQGPSEETRNKIRKALGDPEARKRRSELYTGPGNPFYGKKHSEELKNKMRERKGSQHPCFGLKRPDTAKRNSLMRGGKNHMYGKRYTPEELEIFRRASSGENNPNYGKHWTEKQKKLISQRTKLAMNRPEVKEKFKAGIRLREGKRKEASY